MLILNIVGRLENNQGQQYFQEVLEIIKISWWWWLTMICHS